MPKGEFSEGMYLWRGKEVTFFTLARNKPRTTKLHNKYLKDFKRSPEKEPLKKKTKQKNKF